MTITSSTISNNVGAGIFDCPYYGALLTVISSTISGNIVTTAPGGGICGRGTITLINSTVSSNNTQYSGGGISVSNGTLVITNSTVVSNGAVTGGGNLDLITSTTTLRNTIIANNISGGDCAVSGGVINDAGNNLVEDNSCGFTGGADPLGMGVLLADKKGYHGYHAYHGG